MATLEQIQTRLKKLQAQADAIIAKRAQGALDQIRELMIKHGLTTRDIEARAKARRERARLGLANGTSGKMKSVGATKGKLPPKYRDPKTGATWSGHARPPAWIKNVKDRSKFLIDGGSAAASVSVTLSAKPAAKKAAAKKAATKKTAAKKSMGRKSAAAKNTAVKKAAVKKVAAKKTAGRKAAAKKVASGRAAAGKTAARKVTAGKVGRKAAMHKTGRGIARKVTAHTAPVAAPAAANGAIALS
ncbi:H-NS histone family protein [Paraburkholderia edwinii]|uniref:H-NS histone family protein n=1 Tax=Paraburkholderia edwinii TaxID=2861782 RepID=A0ABX8UV88_9BURK|nr:H-NS histone family protein [Paraburkholderia edwinii]QYD71262.1 H-NS histone family protein [Paraburkholderia edwinii]